MTFKNPFKNYKKKPKDEFKLSKAYQSLFNRYKRSAKDRGIKFDLKKEHFMILITSNCNYCGVEPFQKHGKITYMGIDRLSSDKGYGQYNVTPCCKTCNYAKRTLGFVEFDEWCERLSKHYADKAHMHENSTYEVIMEKTTSRYEKTFYGGRVKRNLIYEGGKVELLDMYK